VERHGGADWLLSLSGARYAVLDCTWTKVAGALLRTLLLTQKTGTHRVAYVWLPCSILPSLACQASRLRRPVHQERYKYKGGRGLSTERQAANMRFSAESTTQGIK
jgi:hypothetical protein